MPPADRAARPAPATVRRARSLPRRAPSGPTRGRRCSPRTTTSDAPSRRRSPPSPPLRPPRPSPHGRSPPSSPTAPRWSRRFRPGCRECSGSSRRSGHRLVRFGRRVWTVPTIFEISCVASCVWLARFFTSFATTAKPRPASPARAASIVAFRARRLVWRATVSMRLRTFPISWLASPTRSAAADDASASPSLRG
jgi:hypothetical protein